MRRTKEAAGCIVRKTPKGIVPVSGFDQEQLMAFPAGSEFKLTRMNKRSIPQHRAYWKALTMAVDSSDKWATAEHCHDALKRACGYITVNHDMTGRPFITTDSTAFDAMTQDEFKSYFDKAMAKLADAIGYDPIAFLEEDRAA